MKRFFTIAAFALGFTAFAQNNDSKDTSPKNTISLQLLASDPAQVGISYERNNAYGDDKGRSWVVNLSYGGNTYEAEGYKFDGTGFVVETGSRSYFGKNKNEYRGLYSGNFLSYGSIKYDETFLLGKFEGTYNYFSFFSPELGYKFKFGNFVVDPFVGAQWKIEIKGKGDVDNNYTDEWAFRGGLKVGYNF